MAIVLTWLAEIDAALTQLGLHLLDQRHFQMLQYDYRCNSA